MGAQAAAPVHISETTTTYTLKMQSFAAPAQREMPLPDWDDDIARQVVDLQAEVEQLEHRIADLEGSQPSQNPPLPLGEGRSEGAIPPLPAGEGRGEGRAAPEPKENSPTKQESEP